MTDTLAELQRLAKEAQDEYWFFPGVVASYSKGWITKEEDAYIAACSPEVILRLVRIAQAAEPALFRLHDLLCELEHTRHDCGESGCPIRAAEEAEAALREALGEKP